MTNSEWESRNCWSVADLRDNREQYLQPASSGTAKADWTYRPYVPPYGWPSPTPAPQPATKTEVIAKLAELLEREVITAEQFVKCIEALKSV